MTPKVVIKTDNTKDIFIEDDRMLCYKCAKPIRVGDMALFCEDSKTIFCKSKECTNNNCRGGMFQSNHTDYFGTVKKENKEVN